MIRTNLITETKRVNFSRICSYFCLGVGLTVSIILTGCGGADRNTNPETNNTTTAPTPAATSSPTTQTSPPPETAPTPETTGAVDQEYLKTLNEYIDKVGDEKLTALAEELTEDDAINDAKIFCQSLDDGQNIDDIIQSVQDDADQKELTPDQQETLGAYLGLVMLAGAKHYCPQHQEQVDQWFNS